jgi:hypothetical protein
LLNNLNNFFILLLIYIKLNLSDNCNITSNKNPKIYFMRIYKYKYNHHVILNKQFSLKENFFNSKFYSLKIVCKAKIEDFKLNNNKCCFTSSFCFCKKFIRILKLHRIKYYNLYLFFIFYLNSCHAVHMHFE